METKMTYIANDGTVFNTKEECEKYEGYLLSLCRKENNNIIAYDKNKKPIQFNLNTEQVIYYVDIKTNDDALLFRAYCNSKGIWGPFECHECQKGFYWYDIDNDVWKSLNQEVYNLKNLTKEFNIDILSLLKK